MRNTEIVNLYLDIIQCFAPIWLTQRPPRLQEDCDEAFAAECSASFADQVTDARDQADDDHAARRAVTGVKPEDLATRPALSAVRARRLLDAVLASSL